jgi:anaerobic selenocysteine-containing dehydrogenase
MGFDDDYWDKTDDELLQEFYDWNSPQLQGITLDLLKEKGFMRLNVGDPDTRAPHAEGNFKTASGKCEFRSVAAEGGNFVVPVWRSMYEDMQPGDPVDPVPDFIAPFESPASNPELAARYPLNIISPKPHAFLNTQYGNEAVQQRRQGEQVVLVHPQDAADRGIKTGSYIRVFNDRGWFEGHAELSEDVMPGLILANVGHWPSLSAGGASVNAISADRHSSFGQAGTYSDNLVDVRLAS